MLFYMWFFGVFWARSTYVAIVSLDGEVVLHLFDDAAFSFFRQANVQGSAGPLLWREP